MPKDYWEINERLADEFSRPPYQTWGDWTFEFEYPGFFVFYHETLPYRVYFTPGWNRQNEVPIQIKNDAGDVLELTEVPFFTDKAGDLHAIIIQWLSFVEWNVKENPEKGVLEWFPEDAPRAWRPREA